MEQAGDSMVYRFTHRNQVRWCNLIKEYLGSLKMGLVNDPSAEQSKSIQGIPSTKNYVATHAVKPLSKCSYQNLTLMVVVCFVCVSTNHSWNNDSNWPCVNSYGNEATSKNMFTQFCACHVVSLLSHYVHISWLAQPPNKALPARLLLKYVLELGSSWLMIFCGDPHCFLVQTPLAQRLKS